jgi:hypothetical protein
VHKPKGGKSASRFQLYSSENTNRKPFIIASQVGGQKKPKLYRFFTEAQSFAPEKKLFSLAQPCRA